MPVIPALISEMEESEEMWAKFSENRLRESVSALDQGLYIAEKMNATGQTQLEIAAILGVSEGWVSQRVGVLRWPMDVQHSLGKRGISFGVARELAGIEDAGIRRHYLRFAEQDGCSVRQAADWRRKAGRLAGTLVSSVPAAKSSSREGDASAFQEKCFVCEKEIAFGGGKYIRLCSRCEGRFAEALASAPKELRSDRAQEG